MNSVSNSTRAPRRWTRVFRLFSPRRLRSGFLAIKQRCAHDVGFRRACTAAVVANALLTVVLPPIGLLAFLFTLVHTMPRNTSG
jgi:hypothetical protein